MALPTERIADERVRALSPEQVALLTTALQATDPLADAVIEELHVRGREAYQVLHDGLVNGRAGLSNVPPAIDALLQQIETLPAWVEPDILRRGSSAYLSIEPLWNDIALSIGSLVHIYAAPAIARVLTGTTDLVQIETATHRLGETAVWVYSTMLPNGLARGERGYIATIQVRLLHARIRLMYLKRGWDTTAWGVPINQADLARTWLDFTYTPYRALTKFGFDFTEPELRDAYHLWQYLGYLLGIDPTFYRDVRGRVDITDHAQAEKLLNLLEAVNKAPDENSRKLVKTMMSVMTTSIVSSLKTPFQLTSDISSAMLRFLHGDALADALDVPKTSLTASMPMLALANRTGRQLARSIPAVWHQLAEKSIGNYVALIKANSAPSEYQQRLQTPATAAR